MSSRSPADTENEPELQDDPPTTVVQQTTMSGTSASSVVTGLLGGKLRDTKRDADEMKAAIVLVPKSQRKNLSTSDKQKYRTNAVTSIVPKFTTLKTKPGTEELENVYSLALLLRSFEEECIKYQMEDVFMILPHNLDGSINSNGTPRNLFQQYKQIELPDIKLSCKSYFEFGSEDYIVENLAWSGEKLLNSCDDSLRQTIQGHSLNFEVHERVGPVYLKVMLDIIFNVSDRSLRALVSRIENMKLSDYNGENVAKACDFLRSAHLILVNCDFMPPDFIDQLYKFFKTAHSVDFQQQISSLQVMISLSDTKNTPEFVIDFAEKQYNTLLASGDWDKAANAKGESAFVSQLNRRKCYNCGSPDHLANKCPQRPQQDNQGRGGRGGRGRGRGGRGGRGGGRGGNQNSNSDDWKTQPPKRGEKTFKPSNPKGFQYWCGKKGCCTWGDHTKNSGPHADDQQANVAQDKNAQDADNEDTNTDDDETSSNQGMVASASILAGPSKGTKFRGFSGL